MFYASIYCLNTQNSLILQDFVTYMIINNNLTEVNCTINYSFEKNENNLITDSVSNLKDIKSVDSFTEKVKAMYYFANNQIVLNRENLTKLNQTEKVLMNRVDKRINI